MRKCFVILVLAIVYGLMTPALSINVGISSGNAGETVSSSSTYDLDESTSLQESVIMGDGRISKDLTARGSGMNSISISSSAKDKSAGTEIESSGHFQTSAFADASSESVGISQGTAISGSYGGITYHADSQKNKMVISSGFEGEGDLNAGISASVGETAAIAGNLNAMGLELIDSESMMALASEDIGISVNGLHLLSDGNLGDFGLSAANIKKETANNDASALLTAPKSTTNGGRSEAYYLMGTRWNIRDPELKLVLKNDAYLTDEGLSASAVQTAIAAAANTWDDATTQNLFADSTMVTINSGVSDSLNDNINTVNFKPLSCAAVATSRSRFSMTKVDGYYSIKESDLTFNTKYTWRTDGSNSGYDIQSVALHELGHTLGLSDLYNKAAFKDDLRQAMHRYTGVKRTLGNGDMTGVWLLYG